jgi:hypothetical protein
MWWSRLTIYAEDASPYTMFIKNKWCALTLAWIINHTGKCNRGRIYKAVVQPYGGRRL